MIAILFWFHLMGIAIWVGASLLLPLAILPSAQALEPPARMKFMGALSGRLLRLVVLSILVVVITGALQAYGLKYVLGVNVITIKIVVAVLMIANGLYLGYALPRRAAALAPAPGTPPSPELQRVVRLQVMHAWIQAGLSVIILLLVGILTAPAV